MDFYELNSRSFTKKEPIKVKFNYDNIRIPVSQSIPIAGNSKYSSCNFNKRMRLTPKQLPYKNVIAKNELTVIEEILSSINTHLFRSKIGVMEAYSMYCLFIQYLYDNNHSLINKDKYCCVIADYHKLYIQLVAHKSEGSDDFILAMLVSICDNENNTESYCLWADGINIVYRYLSMYFSRSEYSKKNEALILIGDN